MITAPYFYTMKNLLQIAIILFLIQATLTSANYKDEITDFTVVKVRDGDTFIINIENVPDVFGNNIAVRIRGIDTPELNDKREEIKAIKAKEELEKLLTSGDANSGQKPKVILYNLGRDKYFRLLASVKVGDVDVAEYLIKKGLAKKYDGGARLKAHRVKRAGSQKSFVIFYK